MNTDATAERIEREAERAELHGAFPAPRRSHRLLWIMFWAVVTGLALGIFLLK
jgi:hypothetical protein